MGRLEKNSSTDLFLCYYVKSPSNSVIQENATKWTGTTMFKNSQGWRNSTRLLICIGVNKWLFMIFLVELKFLRDKKAENIDNSREF